MFQQKIRYIRYGEKTTKVTGLEVWTGKKTIRMICVDIKDMDFKPIDEENR